ncbi:SdrD B-like domain-containing protein [Spirosoma rigui]|uniref:SdrD B-like domain-containing protein n=1 Tax=Spirosoma rigui TaxID=564064 RepID=UPI0009B1367C|nr:SdrD B-like domain-containing protein [Spirosoma rigui]
MKPISTHCLPLSKKITGLATWLRIWLGNFFQCLTGPFSLVSLIPIRWSRYSQVLLVSLIVAATQVIGATSANAGNELLPASNPGRLPVNNWVTAGPKLVGEGLTTFFANGTCTSGSLGGLVWYDYNSDGVRSSTLNEAIGISGVTVTVFSFSSNTALGTTTTGDNGIWSISGIATASYPVRVEFSNLPTYASSTFAGTNSKTTVQLVSAASCAVDLGIQNSADYCQTTDPPLAVTCFLNGAPTSTTAATSTNPVDVLVGFNYSSSSSTFVGKNMLAQKNEMGSVYGLAYDKKRKKLYAGAFLKRHVGLIEIASVPQLGTIYQVNSEGNTPVVSVLTSVTNVGTIATNAARGLGAPTSPSTDAQSFSLVGKIGLGDVEISDDMNTLFTVNLNTKQLVVMPLNAAGAVTSQTNYTIPSPCTTSRPFALKYYRDKLYVGVTCTLEGTATATSALASYVYVFDPATNTFDTTPLLTFPLNYARDPIYRVSASGTQYTGLWKPWSTNSYTGSYAVGGSLLAYPQPLLSDIEFDASGNMMLSLMDRWGHQIGYNNNDLSGVIRTSNGDGVTAGDIRKACLINGTYVIEGSAGCPQNSGGLTGSAADFFAGDFYLNPVSTTPFYHEEVTIGSMAYLPFKNEVAITAFDPVDNFYAGGLIFLNTTTTGAKSRTGIELYTFTSSTGGPIATFGKASGLGDLEAICNQAPKQIGNYIWIDTDRDGVQDANESGLNGVTVQLYRVTSPTSATLEATTTTATVNGVSGFYSFSAAQPVGTAGNLFTSLQDNAVYYVVVGNGQFNTTTQLLTLSATNYKLTTRDVGAGTQPDINDSDGFIYTTTGAAFTNYPVTTITVGDAGFVNHTLDFGLQVDVPASISVTSTTVCYNNSSTLTATGCTGTVTWSNSTTATTLTTPLLTSTTSYTATCTTASGSTTFAVGTVTVLPQPLLSLSASATTVTAGTPVSLSATGCSGTVAWSTGQSGSPITVTPTLASQVYSATCTTGPACFTTASITITTAAPASISVNSATICYGSTATLSTSGCIGTVTWSNGTTGTSLATGTLTSTTSYTATCTTSTGSTAVAVGTVTVSPQPILSLSASSTLVTAGTPVNLSATGCTGTVKWSTNQTGTSISVNPALATQVYSATCTTGPNCFTTASITIQTEAPTTIIVTSETVCYGSSASLMALGCSGTVSWSDGTSGSTLTIPVATSTNSYTATCTTAASSTYAVGTVTVLPQPLLSLSASSLLVTSGNAVTLTASQCTGTVTWSTGETGSVIVVNPALASQTYSATCTTGPDCFTSASVTIQTQAPAMINVASTTVCYGTGATLTATGCVGTVSWSNGTVGSTLTTGLLTSTISYTATCTTSLGSTTSVVATVTVLDQPLLSLSASSTLVTTGNAVTLTASQCTGSVMWSTGETGSVIIVNPLLTTQTYSATCTTGPGCLTTVSITVNTQAPATIAVDNAAVCYGSTATLTATGCVGNVSWNTGATGASLSTGALTSTTSYTATCTTSQGSIAYAVGTVTVYGQPLLSLGASSTLVATDSDVTLTATQCTGTVIWSTGETGSVIVVNPALASQTYSATCTTGPACFTTASITIQTEPAPVISVNNAEVCYGSPATLTATGCVGAITWSDGTTASTLTIPVATSTSSYTVTCTTATSSTYAVGTVVVLDEPLLSLSASSTLVTAGSSVTLTAAECTGYVVWSTSIFDTGVNQIVVNPTVSQTYSATCVTGPACFTSASISIATEAPATVAVNSVTVCYGSPATLTATGCVGSVSWNTGATGSTLTTSALTTTTSYTATCTTATSTTFGVGVVTVLDQPLLTLSASATLVTSGSAVTLTASQCTGGITWSTGETGSVIVVNPALASQTYSATCTTGPACFTSASVTVNTEAPATVAVNSVTVCYGSPATLTATGCVGSVSWNTGATGSTLTTSALTTTTSYTATCTTATSTTFGVGVVTVLDQPLLTLSASATLVTSGSAVTLTASQCTGGITWSTGETGSVIVVNPALASQTYSATCTTGPACFTSASVTVNTEAPATFAVNSVTVCYGSPATLTATGCVGSVSWNTGATGSTLTTSALTTTTSYTATCTTATSTTFGVGVVTVLDQPLLTLSASATLVTSGSAVTLTASQCTGGITWSTGETGSVIVVNPALASQTYSATCTTGPACFTSASVTVNTEAPATVAVNSVTVCYGSPATLTATGCVGSVSWNTGATGSTLTTSALTTTTSYTATCTTATSTTFGVGVVTVLDQPLLTLSASATLVTSGSAVTLTASQCTGGITWSTGETGSVIVVNPALASQTYSATCTTGPACFTSASISIATEAPSSIAVNSVTVCYGSPATLTATGCVGSVSWNTGATGSTLTTSALTTTTSYTATCTTATSTTFGVGVVTVLDQPLLTLSASATLVTSGSAVTLTASQCTGGITWSTGETGSVIVVNPALASQTYSATCTTGPACFTSASVTIQTEVPLCVLTVTAAPGDCDTRTNTYIVMGTITSANGAAVQSLTVTDGLATTTVLLTGNGPVSFTLTGLTSDQATHLVTVASNATTCGVTSTTYTAPASCTVACPAPVTVCQGSQYAVQLDGPTGQLAYQWYRNGQTITGATGSSYTATQAGSYSLIVNNSDLCVGNSCCPRIIEEVAGVPSLTLVTQAPTCNKATSLTNGQLSITGLGSFETGSYTYQYVQGNVFNSATAQPAAAVSVPGNGLLLNTLLGGETITVRVYNAATGCYVDQTVLIPVANCECPPKVCLPLVISKIR